jgi:CheY-like chemotaxis protein
MQQSDPPITGTILVADDQAANRELLEELLTAQGSKVITVPDGAAAVEELSKTQVDLVLLDVMMPRLNGFDFLTRPLDRIELLTRVRAFRRIPRRGFAGRSRFMMRNRRSQWRADTPIAEARNGQSSIRAIVRRACVGCRARTPSSH